MTRESAWDDDARGRALRLVEYESLLCKCGCGLPIAEAHNDQAFVVDKAVCYAQRAARKVARAAAEEAKRNKKPDGWDDGIHYFARPMKEDDRAH